MDEDNSEEKLKQAGKAVANKAGQVAKNASKKAMQKTKQLVMKLIATHLIQIAIIVAIVVVVIIILAAICYFIKIDDGSHQDGNWNNTAYVVSQKATGTVNTGNITGNPDSGYTLGIDLDAKVEEVLKTLQAANGNSDFDGDITNTSFDGSGDGTRLAAYLSEKNRKQYLKDFIKAEIVTQYPDLRKNPDEELPENELQGVIKVKRAKSDGNTKTLRYVDEENFNSYVELYNQNGDTKAADYFTLNSSGDLVVAKWNKTTTTVTRDSGGDSSPDTKDPSTNQDYNVGTETKYTMTTTSINYKSMVEQYTMPFDFIWALLVMTEDEEFAHNVSKLALDSEIVFTVNDNKTTTKTEDVYTYKKQTKTKTTVNSTVTANVGNGSTSKSYKKEGEKEDSPINYKVTKTVTEEDTNPVIDLTYADTWIAEYKNNYSNKVQEEKVDKKDPVKKNNIDYKKNKEDKKLTSQNSSQDQMQSDNFVKEALDEAKNDMKTNKSSEILENELEKSLNNKLAEKNDGSYKFQIANDIIGQLKQKIVDSIKNGEYSDSVFNSWNVNNRIDTYKGTHKNNETVKNEDVVKLIKEIINSVNSVNKETAVNNNINGVVDSVLYEYFRRTTNQEINTTITTNGNKYTQGTPTVTEKTDKDASEENFITLFNKSDKAKNTLTSTPDWFFEMLENSPSASDMVDIVKYLLFKATDKSYGVEEFDFNQYKPQKFSKSGDALVEFTCCWENENLWNYMYGNGDYNAFYVSTHITEDKKYYKMQPDDGNTVEYNRNFGFGICFYSNGTFMHEEAFSKLGINIRDEKYQKEGALLEVEIVDKIKYEILRNNRETIKNMAAEEGVTLDEEQIAALADAKYQYGNIGNFFEVYKSVGQDRKNTAIRNFEATQGGTPFGDVYDGRGNARWKLFSEGIYTTKSGRVITPSSGESVGGVVEYALQFVGENHSKFTSYFNCPADWCAMFVSYCFDNCGLVPDVLPRTYLGCGDGYRAFGEKGKARRSGTYTPKAGDVIFFSNDNGATCYHTGIVTGCDGNTVYTVEGNTGTSNSSPYWAGSSVQEVEYSINDARIWGYGET